MSDEPQAGASEHSPAEHSPSDQGRYAAIRLAIGLVQGLAVWGLSHAMEHHLWPATNQTLYSPLVLVTLFAPLIVIQALGRMQLRTLGLWTLGAAVVLAGLGVHDALRQVASETNQPSVMNSPLIPLCALGLFIAHALVSAADHDRRLVGRYPTHFELAWKGGLQTALGVAFVGVFWALLWLGAALFNVIGIDGFGKLLQKAWFSIPATFLALAASLHLTDVRVGLIRGVRTVALTLLSWLTPMMALIAVGFLAALPITGLKPLFETRAATAILLAAAAVLVGLINTIFQDGDPEGDSPPPRILRWTARVAAVTLVPIVAIAGYALALRIGQYGLTPERIIAVAAMGLATVYAVGYPIAALKPNGFMPLLKPTNLIGAYLALASLLALLSPIADPARLSVDDQMARLAAGKVRPDKFDFQFLRFDAETYGRKALERLKHSPNADIRKRATEALALTDPRYDAPAIPTRVLTAADFKVVTPGKTLPASFLTQPWLNEGDLMTCGRGNDICRVVIEDFDRDGADDILVVRPYRGGLYRQVEGHWTRSASLEGACQGWEEALDGGKFAIGEPGLRDLVIDGRPLRLAPTEADCPARPTPLISAPVR